MNTQAKKNLSVSTGLSIDGYRVALIDEFSMISKANFKDIHEAVYHADTQVIFVVIMPNYRLLGKKSLS